MRIVLLALSAVLLLCVRQVAAVTTFNVLPLGQGLNGNVDALASYDNMLIAGGLFSDASGTPVSNIAAWNGTTWLPLGTGISGTVRALTVYNGKLIAGGEFSGVGNNVAMWDGTSWQALSDASTHSEGVNSVVYALQVFEGKLIVGGRFDNAGGHPASWVAAWDGTSWSAMGDGLGVNYQASFPGVYSLAVYNGELFGGGSFTQSGASPVAFIGKWNGSSWVNVGTGLSEGTGWVYTMTLFQGHLIAGGEFLQADGSTVNRVASWNGSNWQPIGNGFDAGVGASAVYNNTLFMGGAYTNSGTTPVSRIAHWDGQSWSGVGSGMNYNVQALTTFGQSLIAGGWFTIADGKQVNYVAAITASTQDSLFLPSASFAPGDKEILLQPVDVHSSQPVVGLNIPVKVPAGVDSVIDVFLAPSISAWNNYSVIKRDSGFIQIVVAAPGAQRLPAGRSTVAYIRFKSHRLCSTMTFLHWDTALSAYPARQLSFADTTTAVFYPHFDRLRDSATIAGYAPGNVNGVGIVDLSDLSCLVSYLTGTGSTCILNMTAANMNGKGIVDIGDLSALVNYVSGGGFVLQCAPAAATAEVRRPALMPTLASTFADGVTTLVINSDFDLSAIQVNLKGASGTPVNLRSGKLDLLAGERDGLTALILIDLKGKNVIEHGYQRLLEIPGQAEVVSATVSDMSFESLTPLINSTKKPADLPKSFSLNQNYPNPFNPTTTIGFSLPVASGYTLTIFNVTGQVVREFGGSSAAGNVSLTWDASGEASGVYFYKLTAGSFTQTKKMLLLK